MMESSYVMGRRPRTPSNPALVNGNCLDLVGRCGYHQVGCVLQELTGQQSFGVWLPRSVRRGTRLFVWRRSDVDPNFFLPPLSLCRCTRLKRWLAEVRRRSDAVPSLLPYPGVVDVRQDSQEVVIADSLTWGLIRLAVFVGLVVPSTRLAARGEGERQVLLFISYATTSCMQGKEVATEMPGADWQLLGSTTEGAFQSTIDIKQTSSPQCKVRFAIDRTLGPTIPPEIDYIRRRRCTHRHVRVCMHVRTHICR